MLVIPITVGLIIIAAQSFTSFILEKQSELDIFLEEPVSFFEVSSLLEESNFEFKTNYVFEWNRKTTPISKEIKLPKSERIITKGVPALPASL